MALGIRIGLLAAVATALIGSPLIDHVLAQEPLARLEDPEAYAVYAAVFSWRTNLVPPQTEIALLDETRPQGCGSRDSVDPNWVSVWEGHAAANQKVLMLRRDMNFDVPVTFVTLDEVMRLLEPLGFGKTTRGGWSGAFYGLPGRKLHGVSAVGFNQARTQAMLYAQETCTTREFRCGSGSLVSLIKREGAWQRADVRTCGWMS